MYFLSLAVPWMPQTQSNRPATRSTLLSISRHRWITMTMRMTMVSNSGPPIPVIIPHNSVGLINDNDKNDETAYHGTIMAMMKKMTIGTPCLRGPSTFHLNCPGWTSWTMSVFILLQVPSWICFQLVLLTMTPISGKSWIAGSSTRYLTPCINHDFPVLTPI